jgi:hypothetical protein
MQSISVPAVTFDDILPPVKDDGVAKSSPYYVAVLFQDFDILYVCLHP